MPQHRPKPSQWDGDRIWKWCLRFGGMVGIFYEAVISQNFHYELLPLFGGMIGLDKILEWDARRRERKNGANGKT